jgi:hypothetical protein
VSTATLSTAGLAIEPGHCFGCGVGLQAWPACR